MVLRQKKDVAMDMKITPYPFLFVKLFLLNHVEYCTWNM